jgi:ubiquitin C-terminal hydrolase
MIKEEGSIPPVGWSSLFETPRLSPVGKPTPTSKVEEEALHIIAAGSPVMISSKKLQSPCKILTKGLTNNGNMCFLNSVMIIPLF